MGALDSVEHFGEYLLLHRIAIGGMAEIFLALPAQQARRENLLVIKRIREDLNNDEDFVKMFVDEAQLVSRLAHQNIIKLYKFGQVEGHYYIALEYVWGESLRTLTLLCNKNKLRFPMAAAISIAAGVAQALDHAHHQVDEQGQAAPVIHRDVTLGNVVVSYSGDVKVLDYGIAKAKGRLAHTRAGQIKGTLSYLAPEQLLGKPIGPQTDIYQLGVLLYQLVVGRIPVSAENEASMMSAIVYGQVKRPSQIVSDFPKLLEKILLKALAKDPKKRFASAREFHKALHFMLRKTPYAQGPERLAHMMQNIAGERQQMQQSFIDGILAGVEVDEKTREVMRWASADDVPENLNVELSVVTSIAELDDFEDEATRISATLPEMTQPGLSVPLPLADADADLTTMPTKNPVLQSDAVPTSVREIPFINSADILAGPSFAADQPEAYDDDVATININAAQAAEMMRQAHEMQDAENAKADSNDLAEQVTADDGGFDSEDMSSAGDNEPSTLFEEDESKQDNINSAINRASAQTIGSAYRNHGPVLPEKSVHDDLSAQSLFSENDPSVTLPALDRENGHTTPARSEVTEKSVQAVSAPMVPLPVVRAPFLADAELPKSPDLPVANETTPAFETGQMQAKDFDAILGLAGADDLIKTQDIISTDNLGTEAPAPLTAGKSESGHLNANDLFDDVSLGDKELQALHLGKALPSDSQIIQAPSGRFKEAKSSKRSESKHTLHFIIALFLGILLGLGAVVLMTVPDLSSTLHGLLSGQPHQEQPAASEKNKKPKPKGSELKKPEQQKPEKADDNARVLKKDETVSAQKPALENEKTKEEHSDKGVSAQNKQVAKNQFRVSVNNGFKIRHGKKTADVLEFLPGASTGFWDLLDLRGHKWVTVHFDVDDMGAVLTVKSKRAVAIWSGPVYVGKSPQTIGPSHSFGLNIAADKAKKRGLVQMIVTCFPQAKE